MKKFFVLCSIVTETKGKVENEAAFGQKFAAKPKKMNLRRKQIFALKFDRKKRKKDKKRSIAEFWPPFSEVSALL